MAATHTHRAYLLAFSLVSMCTFTNKQANPRVDVRSENLCVHTHPKPRLYTLCARSPHEYHLRWRDRQTSRGKLVAAPHHRRELSWGFFPRDGWCCCC